MHTHARAHCLIPTSLFLGLCNVSTGPLNSGWQWEDLPQPFSPLSGREKSAEKLENLLTGFDLFEEKIGYKFNDRAYLLQVKA